MGCSVEGGTLDSSVICVFENGKGVEKVLNIHSQNLILLDFNKVYLITLSKPGYISKTTIFKTHATDERRKKGFDTYEFDIKLFKINPTESPIKNHITSCKVRYSIMIDDFDYFISYVPLSKYLSKKIYPEHIKFIENGDITNTHNYILDFHKTSDYFFFKGLMFYKKNDTNNALVNFLKSLKINPENVGSMYNASMIHLNKNNIDSACYFLSRIKEIGKTDGQDLLLKWCNK